jgi:hypothetical protein
MLQNAADAPRTRILGETERFSLLSSFQRPPPPPSHAALPLLPRCLLLLPVAPFLFPQPASHLLPAVSCSSSPRTMQSPSRMAGRRRGNSGARGVNAPPPSSPRGSCHGSVDLGVRRRRHPGRAESSGRGGSTTDPVGGELAPAPTAPPAGAVEPGGGP